MLKRIMLLTMLMMLGFSCFSDPLVSFLAEEVFVRNQVSTNDRVLLIVEKKSDSFSKDQAIVIIQNNDVLNYMFIQKTNSRFPVSVDERYIALGNRSLTGSGTMFIIVYDYVGNRFIVHDTETVFLAFNFLYDNNLYYSGEKAAGYIKRVDLISEKYVRYTDFYLQGAAFFEKSGVVYAVQRRNPSYPGKAFEIHTTSLVKVDLIPEIVPKTLTMQDLQDDDITINLNNLVVHRELLRHTEEQARGTQVD